jgi:hypothetical protein
MTSRPSLDDYVDVAERVAGFIEKFPEGSLQTVAWEVQTVGERLFVVYQAAAFRTPGDQRPGIGTAWEPFPGATPYTRDSELMNAETAAWGRAIVACGLPSKKIASRQEVRARQTTTARTPTVPQPEAKSPEQTKPVATAKQRGMIFGRAAEKGMTSSQLANVLKAVFDLPPFDWPSEEDAHKWLQSNLDRMPQSKVDAVLAGVESAAGQLALAE